MKFFAYTNKSKHDILRVVSLRKNNGFLGKILAKILSPILSPILGPILGPILSPILGPILGPVHGSSPCFVLCQQDHACNTLRKALINSPVMNYFDVNKATEVTVDASPVGLSAILAQRDSPSSPPNIVAYASRALTSTERRYSQTEKEALAVVWGIEYFRLYLYGATFTLYTDHKALEVIFGNPTSKPPARIERWFLRLQQYKFRVVYKSGSANPADYLSRHPPDSKKKQPKTQHYQPCNDTYSRPFNIIL